MRNYGAAVADVAVLVIDIDAGFCQQTQECIGIIESLHINTIVCINKIDLLHYQG
jgi:translation initiation factor IF-2